MTEMLPIADVAAMTAGLGYDRVELLHGSTYRDCSTVVLIPTRGMVHHRFVSALHGMIAPMNQKRAVMFCAGDEVGKAYDNMICAVLAHPDLSRWKYILTIEDDNIVPADAHIRLLESIEAGPFDAIGGLYFTKGDINMPMAYGDPDEYTRTGVLDFRPRDVVSALAGGHVMRVNGIAMGCSLYRMSLFRELPAPWFVTVADIVPDKGPQCFTQDLFFCQTARRAGKTFGVDARVRVGHLDVTTGVVY